MILPESLIDKAHTGGHITVDDLLDAVPDTVETPEQWEVALNNRARTIRLPSSVTGTMRLIRQARERLRDRLGREPTDAELAQKADVTPDRVQQLRYMTQQVVSLDAPLGGHTDQQITLGHVIEDRHTPLPMSQVTKQLLREDMRRMLRELSARERGVLRSRFGLDSSESHTLEEVANEMGVTRERVRQIQGRALRKLRSSRHVRRLRDYWRR